MHPALRDGRERMRERHVAVISGRRINRRVGGGGSRGRNRGGEATFIYACVSNVAKS